MNESEYMKEARRLVDALHRACTFGRCEEAEAALLSHIAKGEQARAAHPSGGGEAGWRPIETAPKHEEVLAWREDAGAMLSIYTTCADSGWLSDKEQDEMDEDTLWKEDWWWFGPHGVCRMEGREVPTHWMPLPADPDASPTTAGQQAGGGEDGKHCQVQVIHLTDQQREMLSAKGVTHIPGRSAPADADAPIPAEVVRRALKELRKAEAVYEANDIHPLVLENCRAAITELQQALEKTK